MPSTSKMGVRPPEPVDGLPDDLELDLVRAVDADLGRDPTVCATRHASGARPTPRNCTGIEWTIKDGIAYHAPTLAAEVRDIVKKARAAQAGR